MLIKQQKQTLSKQNRVEFAPLDKDVESISWGSYFTNPDPVLETEASGTGIKLYDEVARDGHTASVLQTRYLAVVGKEWSIVPAKTAKSPGRNTKESREQKIAQFVESVLMNCNFDQMRLELLRGILYGYYGAEIIWKIKDSQIVVDKFLGKHPRRLCFNIERGPRLITPENMIEGEPIPDRKFLIFQYGDSDNPYGQGLGQKLWWPVWFKKHGIKFWVVFMEKFGMPTPLGKYPPQAKEQRAQLLTTLKAIQKDNAIVIPEGMNIELLEAARQGDGSYHAACEYFDRQISKVVLGQTLTTEIGKTGSYAASQTHNQVRQDIMEADADLLDAYLNKTLVPWIVDYNFPGVISYPRLVTQAGQKPDLKVQSEIDKTLAVEVGLPIAKSYFYETYGIPEPQSGEELVEKVAQGGIGGQFAESRSTSPMQRTLDNLSTASVDASKQARQKLIDHIRKVGEKAKSLQEFRDKIYAEYPEMPIKNLETIIKNALITSRLYGHALAQENITIKNKKYGKIK